MLAIFQGLHARKAAEKLCSALHPNEVFQGSAVCVNEPGRFVVRVFYGQREMSTPAMLPPWRECLIVAVDKKTFIAEPVEDGEAYRPVLR